jgi:transcriptional regulator with XRE-family HTH domain
MAKKVLKKSPGPLNENEAQYKKIGNRIKQLRLKAGYTSAEKFAYENEISRAQYARYERGVDMQISSLLKILSAHSISLQEFFKGAN